MVSRVNSGDLRHLLSFQRKGDADDGFGTIIPGAGPFAEVFHAVARLTPLRGGTETIVAGRLAGVQPYTCTFRSHPAARDATTDWRIVDLRTNKIYQVKSPISDPDQKNAYLDMLIQEGAVT